MNYYKRHIGDYAKKAGHLSLLEHGVYTLLLDAYYDREQAPTRAEAMRISRCRTDEELAALDAVLSDFFDLKDGRYVQARVEEEFVKAEAQARANQENGKRGGRPRKPKGKRTETHSVSDANPSDSENNPNPLIHQSTNPIQEQEPVRSPNGSRLPPDWTLPGDWRAWAEQERPDVDVIRESRVFADYWASQAGAKGRKADWQATWRNWIRRADGRARGSPNGQQPMGKQAQGLMALEAMKSGNRMAEGRTAGGASTDLLLGPGTHPRR